MKGVPIMKGYSHALTVGQMVGLVDHNAQFHVDLPLLIENGLFINRPVIETTLGGIPCRFTLEV